MLQIYLSSPPLKPRIEHRSVAFHFAIFEALLPAFYKFGTVLRMLSTHRVIGVRRY